MMKLLPSGFPDFNSDFKETLDFYTEIFEKELALVCADINKKSSRFPVLADAVKYSLTAGGKRIRPVIVMEFCRICGGDLKDALPAAAAIEMIHTFSLIHDDLPCMDDDDMRRGRPSCHIAFGEANALLAGDALTVEACGMLADSGLSAEKALKMISALCRCSYGMIGGQIMDIEGSFEDINDLYTMYMLKTSELLIAAAEMGCIAAGADEKTIESAVRYAYSTGLAFQLVDDVLDVTSDEATLGKPVGSDACQNKITSITLTGIDEAMKEAQRLSEEAEKMLCGFENSGFLLQLTDMLLKRKK